MFGRTFAFTAATIAITFGCSTAMSPPSPTAAPAPAPAMESAAQPPVSDEVPVLVRGDRQSSILEITTACSETDIRVPIAIIAWPGNRAQAEEQRLEVTVFKDGWERGWWASMPVNREGKFEYGPRLESLGRDPGRPFDIYAQPRTDLERNKNLVVMEVRNLEPGVVYWWRLATQGPRGWTPGEPERIEAPVCVADEVRER